MNETEACCKCGKPFDDGVAAWDGKGHEACWKCFGTYGWRVFPNPPTPEERHKAFLESLKA